MDIISAISTPYGIGGVALIRVSGAGSIELVDTLFVGRHKLSECSANSVTHGKICRGGEMLDEVLVSVFHAPHSFTGEEMVEIGCHGSMFVQQTLLQWLNHAGARLARPGEFTERAFLNGKIDLVQAEAVADLIASQSREEHRLAMAQMRGSVSGELAQLRDKLLTLTSLLELELDFADHEELEFADRGQLLDICADIKKQISGLIDSFEYGNAVKNGVPVAIIGATNVGKSTILNKLVGDERAIVSDIHGTTRDTIEDTVVIGGVLFRFVDTAGIRQTDNEIEQIGIERSRRAAENARIVIVVHDVSSPKAEDYSWLGEKMVIDVYNKADLLNPSELSNKQKFYMSAKTDDLTALKERLLDTIISMQTAESSAVISNQRHYEALQKAASAADKVAESLKAGISGEFVALDLHDCLDALGEITGKITNDEILKTIFSRFCIGK